MDHTEKQTRRLRAWVYALSFAALAAASLLALCTPGGALQRREAIAVSRTQAAAPSAGAETSGKTRRAGVYTLLLAGLDDGNGNTDTIMLARLDAEAQRLDVVSLPRDTMVNTGWNVRKLNAAYTVGMLNGEAGGERLREEVARLTGFEADNYAVLRLGTAERVIDALGGVDFEVPMAMDYEDAEQGLRIHLRAGRQHLNGAQALGLCRFRSGYASADLGRIDMQQRFLRACAEQFIRLGNIPNLPRVVKLLSEELETDLSAGSIGWFLRQLLRCPGENIHFSTVPCRFQTVHGLSYTVLELDGWLGLLNEGLSPWREPITAEELDLVYYRDGALHFTREPRFALSGAPGEAVPAMAAEREPEAPAQPRIVVIDPKNPA